MAGVEYERVGPWWTLDGPSLRLPTAAGRYVSVWMTGAGPLVALLPPPGGPADWWLSVVPLLEQHMTVMALDNQTSMDASELATVLAGTGAQVAIAGDEAAASVLLAARESGVDVPHVHYEPYAFDEQAAELNDGGRPEPSDAERLVDAVRRALLQLS